MQEQLDASKSNCARIEAEKCRLETEIDNFRQKNNVSMNESLRFILFISAIIFILFSSSPGSVSHWTLVSQLHQRISKTCSRHIFFHVPTSLATCFRKSTSSEHCSDFSHVTAPYKLSFYYQYYYLVDISSVFIRLSLAPLQLSGGGVYPPSQAAK